MFTMQSMHGALEAQATHGARTTTWRRARRAQRRAQRLGRRNAAAPGPGPFPGSALAPVVPLRVCTTPTVTNVA